MSCPMPCQVSVSVMPRPWPCLLRHHLYDSFKRRNFALVEPTPTLSCSFQWWHTRHGTTRECTQEICSATPVDAYLQNLRLLADTFYFLCVPISSVKTRALMPATLLCTLLETLAISSCLSLTARWSLVTCRQRVRAPSMDDLSSSQAICGLTIWERQVSGRLIRPIPKVRRRWQCHAQRTFNESKNDTGTVLYLKIG